MSEAAVTLTVDIEAVARRVLNDPAGLSGVGQVDLAALASFALLANQELVLTPELAAAIAAVFDRRDSLAPAGELYRAHGASERDFEAALDNLQTIFETEFPNDGT